MTPPPRQVAPPPDGAILLTAAQVAAMLAVSVAQVMALARAGELQIMSVTHPEIQKRKGRGEYRFGRADVEAFVRNRLGYITPAGEKAPMPTALTPPSARKAGDRFRIR